MKRLAFLSAFAVAACAANASYYIAGDFQGWSPGTTLVTETSPGSGVFAYTGTVGSGVGQVAAGRHEFKFTKGDWSWTAPGSNAWFYAPASGQFTLTLDTNTYVDTWSPETLRVGIPDLPDWTAVGDWQSQVGATNWDTGSALTKMHKLYGTTYAYDALIAKGSYKYKAVHDVVNGTWDGLGGDGNGVGSSDYLFDVTWSSETRFLVDPTLGTVKVEAVPEPASFAVFGLGLIGLIARRRR